MSPKLLAHLGLVAANRVTYRTSGRGRSYRVWASDHLQERRYVTSTPMIRTLIEQGLARTTQGWRHGAGTVELTHDGHKEVKLRMGPFWTAFACWPG